MTDILDRILDAKTKGASFSKDELETLMRAGREEVSPAVTDQKAACGHTWIVRGSKKEGHFAVTDGPRHVCVLIHGHPKDCRCVCGHSLNKERPSKKVIDLVVSEKFKPLTKQAIREAEVLGRPSKKPNNHLPQVPAPVTKEERKTRPRKSVSADLECDECGQIFKISGYRHHKRMAHGERGKVISEKFKALAKLVFQCPLCNTKVNGLGPFGKHLMVIHHLPREKRAETMAKARTPPDKNGFSWVADPTVQVIVAEVMRKGKDGASVMELAKVASVMSQEVEPICQYLVKQSVFKLDVSWGVPKYVYLGTKSVHDREKRGTIVNMGSDESEERS